MKNFLFTVLLVATPLLSQEAEKDRVLRLNDPAEVAEVVERIVPHAQAVTVAINIGAGSGSGSGVIISPDGLVLSAAHVTMKPGTPLEFLLTDGRVFPGVSLGYDEATDASMAKISAPGPLPFLPAALGTTYQKGDIVIATGHPGGPHKGRPPVVRVGRILRAGTSNGFTDPLSTNAFVISGDSGGPVFNLLGEVIGINSNVSIRSWHANNHVPIQVFRDKWDQFVEGVNFNSAGESIMESLQRYDYLEDPFRDVREDFLLQLPQHATAEGLQSLVQRPRLLPLHRMQSFLERWRPAPEETADEQSSAEDKTASETIPQTWHLGLTLTKPTGPVVVAKVQPNGPADRAGLQPNDRLLSLAGQPITNPASLALILRELSAVEESPQESATPVTVTFTRKGNERALQLTPGFRPARRHFRPESSRLLELMNTNGLNIAADEDIETLEEQYFDLLPELRKQVAASVLQLYQSGEKALLAYATLVSEEGEILTKASLLPDEAEFEIRVKDKIFPLELLAHDHESDLALLRFSSSMPSGLLPVTWTSKRPQIGDLVFSPTAENMTLKQSAISRPSGKVREPGYTAYHSFGDTPPYLGIQLEQEQARVSIVTSGSPADRAGILEGDFITQANGSDIESSSELFEIFEVLVPGDKLRLSLERDGETFEVGPILEKPPADNLEFSPRSQQAFDFLYNLSSQGGAMSRRHSPFPECHYHHIPLNASEVGSPLFDETGQAYGINISRSLRHRTLALTVESVENALQRLRQAAGNQTKAQETD